MPDTSPNFSCYSHQPDESDRLLAAPYPMLG